MKKQFLFIMLSGLVFFSHAQSSELDSLLKILKTAPEDTNKLKLLEDISDIAPDGEWQKYSNTLGKLAEKFMTNVNPAIKLAGKKYYSVYLNNKAYGFAEMGDYRSAFDYYERCLKLNQETGNKINSGVVLSSIGAIYERQNDAVNAEKNTNSLYNYRKKSAMLKMW